MAHHAGFHRVIKIIPRYATSQDVKYFSNANIDIAVGDEYSPIVRYTPIFNSKFMPLTSNRELECDAACCALLSSEYLDNIIARIDNIKQMVNNKRDV